MTRRERLAAHEAGHCLCAVLGGLDAGLTFVTDDASGGGHLGDPPPDDASPRQRSAWLHFLLAGLVAESEVTGERVDLAGAGFDLQEFSSFAARWGEKDRVGFHIQRTRDQIRDNRPALDLIAAELVAKGSVFTTRASELVAEARAQKRNRAMKRSMTVNPELKSIDERSRTIEHLISTSSVDRAGDIVDVAGWDLEAYRRNPVVLVDHDYSIRSLIGTALSIQTSPEGVRAVTRFAETELGEAAFELVKQKVARAWSVGFRGIESHSISAGRQMDCAACQAASATGGIHFLRQELLEYSLVAVPMNADAVNNALGKSFAPATCTELCCPAGSDCPVDSNVAKLRGVRLRAMEDAARETPANYLEAIMRGETGVCGAPR